MQSSFQLLNYQKIYEICSTQKKIYLKTSFCWFYGILISVFLWEIIHILVINRSFELVLETIFVSNILISRGLNGVVVML